MCIAINHGKCYNVDEVKIMKKGIAIFVAVLLAVITVFGVYFYIFGGKVQNENFDEVSADYEAIAELCLEYYNESYDKDERITLFIHDNYLDTDGSTLTLTDEQNKALETVRESFGGGCLWVTEDTVIFWRDETKYYGLVYSDNPLTAVRKMKSDWYESVEYHRINSHWYEVGFF